MSTYGAIFDINMNNFSYLLEVYSSYYCSLRWPSRKPVAEERIRPNMPKIKSHSALRTTSSPRQIVHVCVCVGCGVEGWDEYENKILRNGYSQYCVCSGHITSRVRSIHPSVAHDMPACRAYSQLSAVKIYVGPLSFFFFLFLISFRRGTLDSVFHSSFFVLLVFGWLFGCATSNCVYFFLFSISSSAASASWMHRFRWFATQIRLCVVGWGCAAYSAYACVCASSHLYGR